MISNIIADEMKINDYKRQIQAIKGIQVCKNCGTEIGVGVVFCSSCGTPILSNTESNTVNDYVKCNKLYWYAGFK